MADDKQAIEIEEARDTVFCFEFQPRTHKFWTIRFDLHSEYLTITVFTKFDVLPKEDGGVTIQTYPWQAGETCEPSCELFPPAPGPKDWRSWVDATADPKKNPIQHLLRHGFVAWPDMPPDCELPPDSEKKPGPICTVIRKIIGLNKKNVFCDFRGIVTSWQTFLPWTTPGYDTLGSTEGRLQPIFCPEGKPHFPDDEDLAPTKKFLNRIWPLLARTIFDKASENLVGCYLQGGHSIYLSAIGAQGVPSSDTPEEFSPLHFMLLYDGEADNQDDGHPSRWRLSRLTSRLIEVGVRRTASLRYLRDLRKVGDGLKALENRLEEERNRDRTTESALGSLMKDLKDGPRIGGELLPYRVKRNAFHYFAMMNLVDDLGVVKIPGWLPYDQFVKRRLSTTHHGNNILEERYRTLEREIRELQEHVDSYPRTPQKLITLAGFILAFAAVGGQLMEGAEQWPSFGLGGVDKVDSQIT